MEETEARRDALAAPLPASARVVFDRVRSPPLPFVSSPGASVAPIPGTGCVEKPGLGKGFSTSLETNGNLVQSVESQPGLAASDLVPGVLIVHPPYPVRRRNGTSVRRTTRRTCRWLLPDSGTWPDQGEIDMMEMVGWDPDVVRATLHTALHNHRIGTQRGAQKTVSTSCSAFLLYQLDWRADAITIGVDGRAYMHVANDKPGGAGAWPFTRPYRLIVNLAVGCDWSGKQGIDDSAFPQRMTVDSVRYWR